MTYDVGARNTVPKVKSVTRMNIRRRKDFLHVPVQPIISAIPADTPPFDCLRTVGLGEAITIMSQSDKFRLRALACEKLARDATSSELQFAWAEVAIEWHALAACTAPNREHLLKLLTIDDVDLLLRDKRRSH